MFQSPEEFSLKTTLDLFSNSSLLLRACKDLLKASEPDCKDSQELTHFGKLGGYPPKDCIYCNAQKAIERAEGRQN